MSRIKEMHAVDDHTVEVTLTAPNKCWLYNTTFATGIVYDLSPGQNLSE